MLRQLGLPLDPEAAERDRVLDRFEWTRVSLVAHAREIARDICAEKGTVTSTEVMAMLRAVAKIDPGLARELEADPRWMGAVFRGEGWTRVGWTPSGSHKRPVAVWKRRRP